jgi:tetrahydromethanopterin S-methyltransferase subunit D
MIAVIMFFSNVIHVYGVGVPLSSSNFEKDPITGFEQENYVSPGTTGHGIPTISFISGLIGSFLGGIGGSIAFSSLYSVFSTYLEYTAVIDGTIATIFSLVLFFIVAVMASYNIGGTIQGFLDEKFKQKIIPGTISCFLISVVLSLLYVFIIWGLIYG